jgi:hypothetical protein
VPSSLVRLKPGVLRQAASAIYPCRWRSAQAFTSGFQRVRVTLAAPVTGLSARLWHLNVEFLTQTIA